MTPASPASPMPFLLWCLRASITGERGAPPPLSPRPDWPALIETANWHGVLPHLYRSLTRHGAHLVPPATLDSLQALYLANTQHNLLLTGTLLNLIKRFEAQGMTAIPYKGPGLAAALYGNVTWRQFRDLDILVRPREASRAVTLLRDDGYQPIYQLPPGLDRLFHRVRKVYELRHPDTGIAVELHWALTSWTFPFPLQIDTLWERLTPMTLAGETIQRVNMEDTLLMLCVHGAKHHWGRLGWIGDIAALLQRYPELDWGRLFAEADQLGARRMLELGLTLAATLLGITLPPGARQPMSANARVQALTADVSHRLLDAPEPPRQAVEHPSFYLKLRSRWQDKLRCGLYLTYYYARFPLRKGLAPPV